jgi:hypothetical protein
MALSKLVGKGLGRTFGSASNKGKNRLTPDMTEDVVSAQRSDLASMRRALNVDDEPNVRGAARQSVQEAGGRAAIRTGGRAAAGGAALAAGYEGGRMARGEAERTRGRMSDDEEDKTPKRVAVASRSMDDDEESKPAEKKTTFKEAFAAARKDEKKTFTWEGKRYTTEMASSPKPSVREGKNENIDDDTRKKAVELAKGGAVKKKVAMATGGSVPTMYAGMKKPQNPYSRNTSGMKAKPAAKPMTKMAKGGNVKGKK